MIAVVYTGGYAVIQVKHRRVIFNIFRAAFFSVLQFYDISLEALIRLRDTGRIYG